MPHIQKLSEVVNEIEGVIRDRFGGRTFWLRAEVADVKKYHDKRWCFLKFIEKSGNVVTADIKGVFWSNTYQAIERFERATRQVFASGLEISCQVAVRFHKRYGLTLEVLDIDFAYEVGKLELERQLAIERLVREGVIVPGPASGTYYSVNNRMALPVVMQRVALITAPDSDGQRDFRKVLLGNKYGFAFAVTEFLTQIQGDTAATLIMERLRQVAAIKERFDVVVIVRGGGSDTDFNAFNNYELVTSIAAFPIPVLTGIGHDRNTSIADLVARQNRTPTETATFIIDHNMNFDSAVSELAERMKRAVGKCLDAAGRDLENYRQRLANLSPAAILKRGFAIVMMDGRIVTDPAQIPGNARIQTLLRNDIIHSTVTKKTTDGAGIEL